MKKSPPKKPAASKVVSLPGIASQREIKDHQTSILSAFVGDIEAESFTAIAVVGQTSDGRTRMRYNTRKYADLVAAVTMLYHDVLNASFSETDLDAPTG